MTHPERPNTQRKWLFITLQIGIVLLSVAVGYFGHRLIGQYQDEFGLLRQARDIVLNNTILEIPTDQELEYGMIQGLLTTFNDPYTTFVGPAAHEVESAQLSGSFGGIGARLERDTELQWRLYPLPDSPALLAGLQDGDQLIQVDDLSITTETDEVTLLAAIRGPVGKSVTLTILRDEVHHPFTIERQSVPIPSITYNLVPEAPSVGILHVNRIAETSADEIQQGIEDLQGQGATAFILDLRNNGGGLVESAVEIARLFLSEGEVLHQQFRDKAEEVFTVEKPGPFSEVPLVVLINGNTASASEIVAGALQAQGRAPLIGAPTFGKTVIQYIFDLGDGSSVHVTSGRWWIPGVDFPLTPDVAVSDDPNGTVIIQTAINAFTKK